MDAQRLMNSSLFRISSVVLGGPVILFIIFAVLDWYLTEVDIPTIPPPNRERIQYPRDHHFAATALEDFARLPASEQHAIRENLKQALITVPEWLARFRQSDTRVLCLGEDHDDYTRRYLARHLLPEIDADMLLLETTRGGLRRIEERIGSGRPYVRLLNADISKVIRTVRLKNPDILIEGIEETGRQQKDRRRRGTGSRDDSIFTNFLRVFSARRRHVILFGAFHCAYRSDWLFTRLSASSQVISAGGLRNVRVIGQHQDAPMEAFVYFLDELRIAPDDFVITAPQSLHPLINQWFSLLVPGTFKQFQDVIVFRPQSVTAD